MVLHRPTIHFPKMPVPTWLKRKTRYDFLRGFGRAAGRAAFSRGKAGLMSMFAGRPRYYGTAKFNAYRVRSRVPKWKARRYACRRRARWRRYTKRRNWSKRGLTGVIKKVVRQETKVAYPADAVLYTDDSQPQGDPTLMAEDGGNVTMTVVTDGMTIPTSNAPFLQAIQQGDTEASRDGVQIFLKKVYLHLNISMACPCDSIKQYFTIMLIRQAEPDRLTVQEVFKKTRTMLSEYRRHEDRADDKKFSVLKRWNYVFDPNVIGGAPFNTNATAGDQVTAINGAGTNGNDLHKAFKLVIPFNKKVRFKTGTGVQEESTWHHHLYILQQNRLYMDAADTGRNALVFQVEDFRLYFTDS